MNIFILDTEPHLAARFHCDIHLRAMIKESAQMLSTTHRILDHSNKPIYKITHVNHPCTRWVRLSLGNYEWLYELYHNMHIEYQLRFNKKHKSYVLLNKYLKKPPIHIDDMGLTCFAQAMPIQYRQADVVKAYRTFYCHEKLHFAQWSKPAYKPYWVNEFLLSRNS